MSPASSSELEQFRLERAAGRRRLAGRVRWRGWLVFVAVLAAVAAAAGVVPAGMAVRVVLLAVVVAVAAAAVPGALAGFGRARLSRGRPADGAEVALPLFFERALLRLELASAFAVQFEQLRRQLREIAEQRLAGHGVRLGSGEARRLLGEQAWLLLEQPSTADKFAAGPRPAELGRLLDAVERI